GDLTTAVDTYEADIAGGHAPFSQFDAIGLNFEDDPNTIPACTDGDETISRITWSSGTATVTTASPHGLGVGSLVDITDVAPSGYDGDAIDVQTVPTPTTFTYSLATNPGAYTSGGSANSWCDYRDQRETFQKFWCLAKPTDTTDCGSSPFTHDLRVVIVA